MDGLGEGRGPGAPGRGRPAFAFPAPCGSWQLCQPGCTLERSAERGVESWPVQIRGTPGLGLGRLCFSQKWPQDSEPPRSVLGSPLLVHGAQTALTLTHLTRPRPLIPERDTGPSASRTRNPGLQGGVCAWGQVREPGWTSPGGLTGGLQQGRGQRPRDQGSTLVRSALPCSPLAKHISHKPHRFNHF